MEEPLLFFGSSVGTVVEPHRAKVSRSGVRIMLTGRPLAGEG